MTFTNNARPIGAIRFAFFPANRFFKIFLAMGVREPRERLARRWILVEGPGQVVGHLDLARLDVGLDPDPDAIPDPDAAGCLDLLAEPNIGPPAIHRDRRSEGDVVDRRLDLGPGRSVRRLDVERQLDQRKSPFPAPDHGVELVDLHARGL
jgi:hypothetical protein